MLGCSIAAPGIASATTPQSLALTQVAGFIREINPTLPQTLGQRYAAAVIEDARAVSLDPCLLLAVVGVESHFKAEAVSRHGAIGLGQLMPITAASLHVDPTEPLDNLKGTSQYLRTLLDRFAFDPSPSRERRAIAAYNAGPGAVLRNNGEPTSSANATYVSRVVELLDRARSRFGDLLVANAVYPATLAPVSGETFVTEAPRRSGANEHLPQAWNRYTTGAAHPAPAAERKSLFRRLLHI